MVHHGRTHILVQCHDCTACTNYITLEMHGCIHSAYCRMLDNDGSRLYVHTPHTCSHSYVPCHKMETLGRSLRWRGSLVSWCQCLGRCTGCKAASLADPSWHLGVWHSQDHTHCSRCSRLTLEEAMDTDKLVRGNIIIFFLLTI